MPSLSNKFLLGSRFWPLSLTLLLGTALGVLLTGCASTNVAPLSSPVSLWPTSATISVGDQLQLKAAGPAASAQCTWSTSNSSVLMRAGNGAFQARAAGVSKVIAQCNGASASAAVVVKSSATAPIVITRGGTYSGSWISDDPAVPAVSIQTTEPVVIRNSTVASRGDLIAIPATGSGAQVLVENVTGTALDPAAAGLQRGSFVVGEGLASLTVKSCTISGVRFGVKVLSSKMAKLAVTQNLATDLEDRESDGQGGFLQARPDLGHFLMLNEVSLPNGAEIAWNQVVDTIGQSSTEDVFNIYKSQGSPASPISVHDNYMEGNSSPSNPDNYTGSGLITDGDSSNSETAYVTFARNQVVRTAGSGVEIAAGHDIVVNDNRVVSCGIDSAGKWYAAPFVNAVVVWNYYGEPAFNNISVHGTVGGMLRPAPDGSVMVTDIWVRTEDLDASDVIHSGAFTDPCLRNGALNLGAEDDERAFWQTKLTSAGKTVGNQDTLE